MKTAVLSAILADVIAASHSAWPSPTTIKSITSVGPAEASNIHCYT